MSTIFDEMTAYLKLAQAYRGRSQLPNRDRALVLASIGAYLLDMDPLAELCRKMILQNNPGHMYRKYPNVAGAVEDPEFGQFANQIRKKLPYESISQLLVDLNYSNKLRKSDFPTESDYAAAILGLDVDWINENFG